MKVKMSDARSDFVIIAIIVALFLACLVASGKTHEEEYQSPAAVAEPAKMVTIKVHFGQGTTIERIKETGEDLKCVSGVTEVRLVSAEEGWNEFWPEYFDTNIYKEDPPQNFAYYVVTVNESCVMGLKNFLSNALGVSRYEIAN